MSIYNEYQKNQNERLLIKRNQDRINSMLPFQNTYKKEEVDSFLALIRKGETVMEGIIGLKAYCQSKKIVFFREQLPVFIEAFQNYNQNQEIVSNILELIEVILQTEEEITCESFSESELFLSILFSFQGHPSVMNSLYRIVRSSISNAQNVFNFIIAQKLPFPFESLFEFNARNLNLNIRFLSAFAIYDDTKFESNIKSDALYKHYAKISQEFAEFVSRYSDHIFELAISGVNLQIRFECLKFFDLVLTLNKRLFDPIVHHKHFATIFQSVPSNREERIQELKLLKNVCNLVLEFDDDEDNAYRIIVGNNLFPFVSCSMRTTIENPETGVPSIDFGVSCLAIDLLKCIASCGVEATQLLYESKNVEGIWLFLNERNHFNIILSSVMAILEIMKFSTTEQNNIFVQNGFFNILGEVFEAIPENLIIEALRNLNFIIEKSVDDNSYLIQNLFGCQSLMEQLEELCNNEDENVILISKNILSRKL